MESVGQVGETRLLLMAALLLADECFEAQSLLESHGKRAGEAANDHIKPESVAAERLEAAAKQLEDIAARFAHA
jgi:cell division protein ZapA